MTDVADDALAESLVLQDIVWTAQSVERKDAVAASAGAEGGPELSLQLLTRTEKGGLLVRTVVDVEAADATYHLDARAQFGGAGADTVSDDEAKRFGRARGLPALWPYLREALYSMSTRLRLDPVLLPVEPQR